MVTVLDRKLVRDLRSAAGRLLAVASIMAVGVTLYVALGTAHHNLAEAQRRYYRRCRMADFWIDLKKVPLAELEPLGRLPGVGQVRPRIVFQVPVDLPQVAEPLAALVLSLPDQRQAVLNDIVLRSGSYFTAQRDNEVLVGEDFARHHRLRPGDRVHLVLNQRRQELVVVGTAISSEFVYVIGPGMITPDPARFGIFYLKHSFAEEAFGFEGAANQVVGQLERRPGTDVRQVLRRAEQMLAPYGVLATTPLADQLSNRFVSQEIDGLWTFAVVTPAIFLAVAALVLNVLMTRLAEQQRTVLGTLKALGYSDSALFWHLQKLALGVGLGGGLAGCVVGSWMAAWMTGVYRQFFQFPEFGNAWVPHTHAVGLGISVLCAAAGTLRGSRAVLRLMPAEAMRPPAPRQGRRIWLERLGKLWQALGSGSRLVLRNVVRNRVRTAAGVFAAGMGAAVLVNAQMMFDAPYYLMDFQFRAMWRSDVDLTFHQEHGRDAWDEAARFPGVARAEPVLSVPCTFRHGPYTKKGAIVGLWPKARLTVPRDESGRPVAVPAEGLAMSRTLADMLHLSQGDVVLVEPARGLRRPFRMPVVRILENYLGLAVYASLPNLSRLLGEEFAMNGVQLALDGSVAGRKALYRYLKQLPALQGYSTRQAALRGFEDTVLRTQWVVLALMLLFAGTVFFGSVLNASLVSLAERQREVATLYALGYGPWRIGSLLLRESLVTTLLGTALGMPLGYFLTVLTAVAYASEMFRLPVVARPTTWLLTLVLGGVFAGGAHLVVQRAIHRMAWLEAIKAPE